jgi:pyruvate, water dikinase
LGYLGLRPDQIHLSVLVQPVAKAVKASGWLQLSPDHFDLEAVPQVNLDLWQGDRWPECHRYDRRGAQWVGHFTPPVSVAADAPQCKRRGTSGKTNVLSDATLQALVNLAAIIPPQAYSEAPLTLAWILPSTAAQPKLLGFLPDLPLPLHPSLKSIHDQRSAATRQSVQADRIAPLAIGLGASPGQITAPVVVVDSFDAIAPSTCRGVILVTPHLEPIHLPWLQEAAGLLCETGGVTSHGAILARELGCPAIVGLTGMMKTLQTGQWVTLDGRLGKIYPATASDGVPWMTAPLDTPAQEPAPSSAAPLNTQLFASFSQLSVLKDAQAQAIDGICLVRGEWLLLAQRSGPQVLTALADVDYDHLGPPMGQTLGAMAQAIAPRPVYYRSIDRTSGWDERLPLNSGVQNPSLGLRGTLGHYKYPQLFEMELAMLSTLSSQGIANLRLILPYVRSPQEVAFCVEKMRKAGIHPDQLPLWMMAEVPSVLFALEQYRQLGLQGIAIGSSDLAQLLLGIDRDHAAFQEVLNQNRSVLNDTVAQLVQRASALGLSSILCGDLLLHEQPNPQWLAQLIQAGLTGVAVELDAIAKTRGAIVQAEGSPSQS